jgi:hypothetical protein
VKRLADRAEVIEEHREEHRRAPLGGARPSCCFADAPE